MESSMGKWNIRPIIGRSRQGFSLIEVMFVIMIAGIIAGVSAPPVFRYVNSNRLQTNADQLAADLQYARSLSIANSSILRFTATPGGYQLTNPVTGAVIRTKNLKYGLGLEAEQTADFYPWGMADATIFNITNNTGTVAINLMPTGIVEVY